MYINQKMGLWFYAWPRTCHKVARPIIRRHGPEPDSPEPTDIVQNLPTQPRTMGSLHKQIKNIICIKYLFQIPMYYKQKILSPTNR